ncbi:hypothetical protein PanWU01x14_069790 [Parasponia andersonii]|uniref:Uncharacterized protein n=1 Tax=Parasponia andersonii TaxID=3476 RepID=A0A2P5DET0_PARAD|nr:hypothetical protein PanWU01x14_069790 [Parasponia andersonii]
MPLHPLKVNRVPDESYGSRRHRWKATEREEYNKSMDPLNSEGKIVVPRPSNARELLHNTSVEQPKNGLDKQVENEHLAPYEQSENDKEGNGEEVEDDDDDDDDLEDEDYV